MGRKSDPEANGKGKESGGMRNDPHAHLAGDFCEGDPPAVRQVGAEGLAEVPGHRLPVRVRVRRQHHPTRRRHNGVGRTRPADTPNLIDKKTQYAFEGGVMNSTHGPGVLNRTVRDRSPVCAQRHTHVKNGTYIRPGRDALLQFVDRHILVERRLRPCVPQA